MCRQVTLITEMTRRFLPISFPEINGKTRSNLFNSKLTVSTTHDPPPPDSYDCNKTYYCSMSFVKQFWYPHYTFMVRLMPLAAHLFLCKISAQLDLIQHSAHSYLVKFIFCISCCKDFYHAVFLCLFSPLWLANWTATE